MYGGGVHRDSLDADARPVRQRDGGGQRWTRRRGVLHADGVEVFAALVCPAGMSRWLRDADGEGLDSSPGILEGLGGGGGRKASLAF